MSASLLIFQIDSRRCAVVLEQVARVIRAVYVTPLPQAPPQVLGLIDLQGTLLPVLSIRHCFAADSGEDEQKTSLHRPIDIDDQFIIARTARRAVALQVDRVLEIISVDSRAMVPASAILPHWEGVQGIIQLADGLILIQDLDRFLSLEDDQRLAAALGGGGPAAHGK
jgi:purine-binding chemotaxis protein CheW